jgi:predicted glycoside hydrolase/deacetylase ChbG (UPF0249 family)
VTRFLIVNADDFGRSAGINRGIARAHENGIVTSASLMVRYPAAAEAAEYAAAHPELSVGLHADLGEWTHRDGEWHVVYELDPERTVEEVSRQLEVFRSLLGADPSHLDSHQHVHRSEPLRSAMLDLARRLGVPLRDFDPRVVYRGDFYGQTGTGDPLPEAITVETLLATVYGLPEGVTELGCHPGDGDDLESSYVGEREVEVTALCDPRLPAALAEAGVDVAPL